MQLHNFYNTSNVGWPTNEFGIFLKDAPNYPKDGVHDGFNDISPPQEMTLMGFTNLDYVD